MEDLTTSLKASPASIRRDLTRLEEKGLVHRTHGGVMLADNGKMTYEPFRLDASFKVREDRFANEKQRIARAAALQVYDEETIGLGAGTTTTLIARLLTPRKGLHVITNAVNIALELSASARIQTTLTGGQLRWAGAFSLVGPSALETLSSVVPHRVFLGVTGMDPVHGATTIQPEEAAVFRAMAKNARQVIVVADSSKLLLASPAVICPPARIDMLVTDDGITDEAREAFTQVGIRVIVA